jgi:type IV pilus assembly protein PilW
MSPMRRPEPLQQRTGLGSPRGMAMVELLVALLIGLFLLGGLLTLVQDNRRAFATQNQMSQLQDSERLAMTMITNVIQMAGYFPNPAQNTAASTMAAFGLMGLGQAMFGTYNSAPPGDSITVRYATASGDGIPNCIGTSNNTGAVATYINTFSVINGQLICTREDNVHHPLVGDVQLGAPNIVDNPIYVTNLSILYGVNTASSGTNVDTYMNATQVSLTNKWYNVISVRVALTFVNPEYSPACTTCSPTIVLQRDISVMNQVGV